MNCNAITKKGKRCTRKAKVGGFCFQHSLRKKESNNISYKKIITLLFFIGSGLIFIGDLFDFFDLGKPWNKFIISPISSNLDRPSFSSNSAFNVAILPFFPKKNCEIENTDYENSLILRLEELGMFSGNFIEAILIDTEECILNDKDAISLGKRYKADIVIWGFYDEECDKSNKIRIKYNLINENIYTGEFPLKSDSGYKQIIAPIEIMNGELHQDLEYLLYWIISCYYSQIGDYHNAYSFLNKIESYDCSEAVWLAKINCIYLWENYDLILNTMDSISICEQDNRYNILTASSIQIRKDQILLLKNLKNKSKLAGYELKTVENLNIFGNFLIKLNQIDSLINKSRTDDKNLSSLNKEKGRIINSLKSSKDSVYYFSNLVFKDNPNNTNMLVSLAMIETWSNNQSKALAFIESCLKIDPTNNRALMIKNNLTSKHK